MISAACRSLFRWYYSGVLRVLPISKDKQLLSLSFSSSTKDVKNNYHVKAADVGNKGVMLHEPDATRALEASN